MKYALIGCGRIATNHIKAVLNNHLEFAAACDVNPDNIETLLAKHGLEKDSSIARYTDYKKMIEEVKPTLVGIATESGLHAEIALFCIDHGVNCIIEKPMAMSIEDADEIIRRSREKNVKVSACHQNRFNLAVQRPERLWKLDALENCPMVPSMYCGTGTRAITLRLPGEENGHLTEVR